MGKAYANKKPESERPRSDLYQTPYCLTWELIKLGIINPNKPVYEPACGKGAIVKPLLKKGYEINWNDVRSGTDFLEEENKYPQIVTNPPFSLFDDFVLKAKKLSPRVIMLGKTNFFGAKSRLEKGVWKHLKHVYIFNRQVDYRYKPRKDGKIKCGNLITAWFYWNRKWDKDYWRTSVIDIDKYVFRKSR